MQDFILQTSQRGALCTSDGRLIIIKDEQNMISIVSCDLTVYLVQNRMAQSYQAIPV